jgi:hypothetical protein
MDVQKIEYLIRKGEKQLKVASMGTVKFSPRPVSSPASSASSINTTTTDDART